MTKKTSRYEGFSIEWDDEAHTVVVHLEGPIQDEKIQAVLEVVRRWARREHHIEIRDGIPVEIVPTVGLGKPILRRISEENGP